MANSFEFETEALIKAPGFREYIARWRFGHPRSKLPPELNLIGSGHSAWGLAR
ncbi:hypothetical protein X743_20575 [Mesorhizobium sp. LNHC252B00]|nr:hypothetical protein X743_20575 [Mesorhizobium sp. LNHC252B00]